MENVTRNAPPGAIVPEPVKPPIDGVTVWFSASAFVQVTVEPAVTVTVAGE